MLDIPTYVNWQVPILFHNIEKDPGYNFACIHMNLKSKDLFKVHSYTFVPYARTIAGQRDNTCKGNDHKPTWLDIKQESDYDTYKCDGLYRCNSRHDIRLPATTGRTQRLP